MTGVAPAQAGHIIRPYDYECRKCDWRGELRAQIMNRDCQVCPRCGSQAERLSHFATVGFKIPPHMKASYNEDEILPPDKKDRIQFLDTAHKSGYRRRTDIV